MSMMNFLQFVAALRVRDADKSRRKNAPILRSQKILPLDRATHAGTRLLIGKCKSMTSDTAVSLCVLYRCAGSSESILTLAAFPIREWRMRLRQWRGKIINTTAYRPTSWPAGDGTGRRFFTSGLALDLADHVVATLKRRNESGCKWSMLGLAQAFDEFFIESEYNSMMFALQEVVKDLVIAAAGRRYATLADPDSETYLGPGCVDGLQHTQARAGRLQARVRHLSELTRKLPVLDWVTVSDTEHHLCEYNKYVKASQGLWSKPYKCPACPNGFLTTDGRLKSVAERRRVSARLRMNTEGSKGFSHAHTRM